MKEKTAGYFLLAIAIIIALSVFNISLNIIKHSFYTGTLIWGVLVVLIIWIITIFISGMAMMILNYFHIGPFRVKALNDLLSHVRIYGKKAKTNDKIVIVTMRNLVLIAIISIAIMIYSSYAGSLLWGIMIVILMIILLSVMSVFILLVKARI